MPCWPAEFTIGNCLDPSFFLALDRLSNAVVFYRPKFNVSYFSVGSFLSGVMQSLGPQEASDMVRTKWWLGWILKWHGIPLRFGACYEPSGRSEILKVNRRARAFMIHPFYLVDCPIYRLLMPRMEVIYVQFVALKGSNHRWLIFDLGANFA